MGQRHSAVDKQRYRHTARQFPNYKSLRVKQPVYTLNDPNAVRRICECVARHLDRESLFALRLVCKCLCYYADQELGRHLVIAERLHPGGSRGVVRAAQGRLPAFYPQASGKQDVVRRYNALKEARVLDITGVSSPKYSLRRRRLPEVKVLRWEASESGEPPPGRGVVEPTFEGRVPVECKRANTVIHFAPYKWRRLPEPAFCSRYIITWHRGSEAPPMAPIHVPQGMKEMVLIVAPPPGPRYGDLSPATVYSAIAALIHAAGLILRASKPKPKLSFVGMDEIPGYGRLARKLTRQDSWESIFSHFPDLRSESLIPPGQLASLCARFAHSMTLDKYRRLVGDELFDLATKLPESAYIPAKPPVPLPAQS